MIRCFFAFFCALVLSATAAPQAAEEQARHLQTILKQADEAYHNRATSIMSDSAYDALRAQYNTLTQRHPELKQNETVGASVQASDRRGDHTTPILSLKKAISDQEVEAFIDRCGRDKLYSIEPKLDGLTVVLRYRSGLLTKALTRGNGLIGSDITEAIIASGAAPVSLSNAPTILDVRGEAVLPFDAFNALNKRRSTEGKSSLKSPRNTAAGTLRLSDYAEIAQRGLKIYFFDLLKTDVDLETHSDALLFIKNTGLPVIHHRILPSDQILEVTRKMNNTRTTSPIPTDGLVIRVNDYATFDHLGATAHHPRGALARKYPEIPVETQLLRVEWTRGRTGKTTPIGHFTPIEVSGATLKKASLHSLNHLRAMDLKLGDWILVIRAGGSVPEIIGRSDRRRSGEERPIQNADF